MIKWEIKADSFTNCNCNYGCPCQFNAPPTYHSCAAIVAMKIESGYFADIRLNGLKTVSVVSWPGPIHEGNGKALIIIDEQANDEQRNALITVLSGDETDPGATVWNVFSATFAQMFEPEYLAIDMQIDIKARTGKVTVPQRIDMNGRPILNPVTGEEHHARIELPDGFEYRVAEMGSGTSHASGPIELELKDSYGQFAHLHLNNHGLLN